MKAKELLQSGQVRESIKELNAHLRSNPGDNSARRFLFELLVISGDFERAEKQVDVLATGIPGYELEAAFCYSALHGERARKEFFSGGQPPPGRYLPPGRAF